MTKYNRVIFQVNSEFIVILRIDLLVRNKHLILDSDITNICIRKFRRANYSKDVSVKTEV
jgi:hypothetical protein